MKNYTIKSLTRLGLFTMLLVAYGCSSSEPMVQVPFTAPQVATLNEVTPPSPDPRVGLSAGLFDAGEAIWNLEKLSETPPAKDFVGVTNSDLAFKGSYAIQGNYNGVMIWDISNPTSPELVKDYLCPASQSDVSVYGDLLFISGEGSSGRIDCGTEGVQEAVSEVRLRGIRIFDITDITDPQYIANVQTCRGSHTHSVLKDPDDNDNVYIYVSGSAGVRPEEELAGCNDLTPDEDPNSPLFRIEVIKVPLASPEDAAIVSSPRIFEDLVAAPSHGPAPADIASMEEAKANGAFTYMRNGSERVLSGGFARRILAGIVEERGGDEVTAEDSLYLRENATEIINALFPSNSGSQRGPDQCHDITLYPEIGLAGGACEGYGLLLDIKDPANPVRIDAVADSNFSYWHSATFSNDGSKVLFTDEWGGGGQPKCRESDPKEWGANAIFSINDGKLDFVEYYKLPAPQTVQENCVAHNGSMIPVPGRDIMVQAWYQGGISIFDWTDPSNPTEIAFQDRGPVSPDRMQMGGSWSVYWYNGLIVSSEIARGLDIFDLKPSPYLTENEIAAAKTVQWDYLNAQGHPMFVWPSTTALAKAYVDQLDREKGLDAASLTSLRQGLANADVSSSKAKSKIFSQLAEELGEMASSAKDSEKVNKLASTLKDLASM
tara:strand:+ start:51442 stop:53424 length:1983 start_codon:yes stop_codon:yes gene_type:complete